LLMSQIRHLAVNIVRMSGGEQRVSRRARPCGVRLAMPAGAAGAGCRARVGRELNDAADLRPCRPGRWK
jgi:hypothetical protein